MSLELLFVPLGLAVGHTALSVVLTTTRLAKFIHLIFLVWPTHVQPVLGWLGGKLVNVQNSAIYTQRKLLLQSFL